MLIYGAATYNWLGSVPNVKAEQHNYFEEEIISMYNGNTK